MYSYLILRLKTKFSKKKTNKKFNMKKKELSFFNDVQFEVLKKSVKQIGVPVTYSVF